jgi:O-antigen biosynthesis protein
VSNQPAWHRLQAQEESDQPYWIPREFPALNLIQGTPRRALDIGCSAGYAAEQLGKKFADCKVWGVEANGPAAREARTRVHHVIEQEFSGVDWSKHDIGDGFDAVLLLDVLEHMYNPWAALQAVRKVLSPQGEVIVSLPNVRNFLLMSDLANGYWHYTESGLLDVTHIRFFSEYEMLKMCYQTGFRRTHWFSMVDSNWEQWQHVTEFPHTINSGKTSLRVDSQAELMQLATISNVVRLTVADVDALSEQERDWAGVSHAPTVTPV